MPELPEVETVSQEINRDAKDHAVTKITFYRQQLRAEIPIAPFTRVLLKQDIQQVFRRSKYILMETKRGLGIFHLGMTGNFLWQPHAEPRIPHTHLVMELHKKKGKDTKSAPRFLHFIDPRRFGMIHAWEGKDWQEHPYLSHLGPEPLVGTSLGRHLFQISRRRKSSIKTFLMDAQVVVGVGNIYACEALFQAQIHPETPSGSLTEADYSRLARCTRAILRKAIAAGGTTIRDYKDSEGKLGYFAQALQVYGREGQACTRCRGTIKRVAQAGRSSWYCSNCQN